MLEEGVLGEGALAWTQGAGGGKGVGGSRQNRSGDGLFLVLRRLVAGWGGGGSRPIKSGYGNLSTSHVE